MGGPGHQSVAAPVAAIVIALPGYPAPRLNSGAGSNNILGYGSLGDIDAAVAAQVGTAAPPAARGPDAARAQLETAGGCQQARRAAVRSPTCFTPAPVVPPPGPPPQANLLRDKFGGLPLTSYEGGQHLLATGGARSAAVNALLDAVNRDPRMKGRNPLPFPPPSCSPVPLSAQRVAGMPNPLQPSRRRRLPVGSTPPALRRFLSLLAPPSRHLPGLPVRLAGPHRPPAEPLCALRQLERVGAVGRQGVPLPAPGPGAQAGRPARVRRAAAPGCAVQRQEEGGPAVRSRGPPCLKICQICPAAFRADTPAFSPLICPLPRKTAPCSSLFPSPFPVFTVPGPAVCFYLTLHQFSPPATRCRFQPQLPTSPSLPLHFKILEHIQVSLAVA